MLLYSGILVLLSNGRCASEWNSGRWGFVAILLPVPIQSYLDLIAGFYGFLSLRLSATGKFIG